MRALALGSALLGGIAWVADLYVESSALPAVGLVLLGVAVLLVGVRLARQPWLAALAAAGALLLAWSVLVLLRDALPDRVPEAVLGAAASLLVGVAVLRGPRPPVTSPESPSGNHRA